MTYGDECKALPLPGTRRARVVRALITDGTAKKFRLAETGRFLPSSLPQFSIHVH